MLANYYSNQPHVDKILDCNYDPIIINSDMARGRSISAFFRLCLASHKLKKLITISRYYYFRLTGLDLKSYKLDDSYYLKEYSFELIPGLSLRKRHVVLALYVSRWPQGELVKSEGQNL